jgi:hypothetical protein
MREGGKEDKRGKKTFGRRGLLDFWGEHYFHIRRLYYFLDWRLGLYYWFLAGEACWSLVD